MGKFAINWLLKDYKIKNKKNWLWEGYKYNRAEKSMKLSSQRERGKKKKTLDEMGFFLPCKIWTLNYSSLNTEFMVLEILLCLEILSKVIGDCDLQGCFN